MGLIQGDGKVAAAVLAFYRGEKDHLSRRMMHGLLLAMRTLHLMLVKIESNQFDFRHVFSVEKRRWTMPRDARLPISDQDIYGTRNCRYGEAQKVLCARGG